MFKEGDKVKLDPKSRYFGKEHQLPHGVIGVVAKDQCHIHDWVYVRWDVGHNSYQKKGSNQSKPIQR